MSRRKWDLKALKPLKDLSGTAAYDPESPPFDPADWNGRPVYAEGAQFGVTANARQEADGTVTVDVLLTGACPLKPLPPRPSITPSTSRPGARAIASRPRT